MGSNMDLHSEEFLRLLMRRQFRLSASIASVFVTLILVIPLLNLFLPELMQTPVLGFTLSWAFLGIGIFPLLIALAWLFVQRSNAFEDEAIGLVDPSTMPKREPESKLAAAAAAAAASLPGH